MSFDQEWADLKAKSAMRLDSVPADPGGTSPDGADLILRYDDMGKIGHAAFLLHQHAAPSSPLPSSSVTAPGWVVARRSCTETLGDA